MCYARFDTFNEHSSNSLKVVKIDFKSIFTFILITKSYIDSNITGFVNLLEQCKKNKINLIYASSSSVYGNSKNSILNEAQDTNNQISIYGITKKTHSKSEKNPFF